MGKKRKASKMPRWTGSGSGGLDEERVVRYVRPDTGDGRSIEERTVEFGFSGVGVDLADLPPEELDALFSDLVRRPSPPAGFQEAEGPSKRPGAARKQTAKHP